MLNLLRHHRHLARSRFAEALSLLAPDAWLGSGRSVWACYRLGLYATVARSDTDHRHLPAGVGRVVSLAACGHLDQAQAEIEALRRRHGAPALQTAGLPGALAPFAPATALSLLDPQRGQRALHAALLLALGETADAARRLQHLLDHDTAEKADADLHLLVANAQAQSPAARLAGLNRMLARHALPPVGLRDAARMPGPTNLTASVPAHAHGPRISVLMTAYNAQDRIAPAIESLLAQSWRNLEVVVADDASTDDTAEVVQALATRDDRVRYLRMPANVGTYVAKTAAFGLATGEFVTCHDSDDWSHPLRLAWQIRPLLESPALVATTSRWVRLTDDGQCHARAVYPLSRLNPASPLFRRQAVEEHAGLWDTVRTGADSEFHARLKLVFGRQSVRALPVPLAFGAHRPGSLMTAPDTGHNSHSLSPDRLAYWEAWTRWHIAVLRAGGKPVMPRGQSDPAPPRPFAYP